MRRRDFLSFDVLQAQLAFLLHQLDDLRQHERAIDTYVAEPFRGLDWQPPHRQAKREFPASAAKYLGNRPFAPALKGELEASSLS